MVLTGLCIIFILIIIHVILPEHIYNPKYDKLQSIDIDQLRAGDIIFMKYCETCKYNDNILDNAWITSYRKLFNSARTYITGQYYTHVAIVLNINKIPCITHIDKGTMYDLITKKRQKGKVLVSPWEHLNRRGGPTHVYRYTGKKLPNSSLPWIHSNKDVVYPQGIYNLMASNALKWQKNPDRTMACTDYIECTMKHYDILDRMPSNCATINDIYNLVRSHKSYTPVPLIVKNKCYLERHYS